MAAPIPVPGSVQYCCTFRRGKQISAHVWPEALTAREAARLALEDYCDEPRVIVRTYVDLKAVDEAQIFTREELGL